MPRGQPPPPPPGVPAAGGRPGKRKIPNKHEGPVMSFSGVLAGTNCTHFWLLADLFFDTKNQKSYKELDILNTKGGQLGMELLAMFTCAILFFHPYIKSPGQRNTALYFGIVAVAVFQLIVFGLDVYDAYCMFWFIDNPYVIVGVYGYFDLVLAILHIVVILVSGPPLVKFCLDCIKHNNGKDACPKDKSVIFASNA